MADTLQTRRNAISSGERSRQRCDETASFVERCCRLRQDVRLRVRDDVIVVPARVINHVTLSSEHS